MSSTEDETVPLSALVRRAPVMVFTDNTLSDAAGRRRDQKVVSTV